MEAKDISWDYWRSYNIKRQGESAITKITEPRLFIRYKPREDSFDLYYEEFKESILEIIWFDGEGSDEEKEQLIKETFDFIVMDTMDSISLLGLTLDPEDNTTDPDWDDLDNDLDEPEN